MDGGMWVLEGVRDRNNKKEESQIKMSVCVHRHAEALQAK